MSRARNLVLAASLAAIAGAGQLAIDARLARPSSPPATVVHEATTTAPDLPTEPCATEDSPGPCFWDAGMRGNGRGMSFWVDAKDRRFYLTPQPSDDDVAYEEAEAARWRPFRDVEGHRKCMIRVGDTSYVRCADGFRTES